MVILLAFRIISENYVFFFYQIMQFNEMNELSI